MEQAFLLDYINRFSRLGHDKRDTYSGDTERHDVEGERGQQHDHEDDPTVVSQSSGAVGEGQSP